MGGTRPAACAMGPAASRWVRNDATIGPGSGAFASDAFASGAPWPSGAGRTGAKRRVRMEGRACGPSRSASCGGGGSASAADRGCPGGRGSSSRDTACADHGVRSSMLAGPGCVAAVSTVPAAAAAGENFSFSTLEPEDLAGIATESPAIGGIFVSNPPSGAASPATAPSSSGVRTIRSSSTIRSR